MSIIIILFLAFAYRVRGGAIPLGSTTLARVVFWALPVGCVCTLIAHAWEIPLWIGAICAAMAFAGACIGHASQQGNTLAQNEGMGYITTLMLGLIVAPFLYFNPWFIFIVPFGLLGGIAYYLGYKINRTFRFLGVTWCVPGDVSWGEILTGGLAFGLPLSILYMSAS